MEKSKTVICKTFRFLIMVSILLMILEMNSFRWFRSTVASIFPFLIGKRELVSNIFIGFWGSAVFALLNEWIEYNDLKKKTVTVHTH